MRSVPGLFFSAIQENPSIAAGICVFAVAFSLVAGNALYGQRGGHPGPLFATRDSITTRSVPVAAARQTPVRRDVRKPHIPVPVMRPQDAATPGPASTLVRDAQAALAAIGMYQGEIDGLFGPKTRDAILQFEKAAKLEPTGQVSQALARQVADYRSKSASRDTRIATAEQPSPTPSAEPPVKTAAVERDESRPVSVSMDEVRDTALVARIQIGLINFGESGISVDGMMGERTELAIRRFQDRYGLPVNGKPDESVLRKMEQIGALKKS